MIAGRVFMHWEVYYARIGLTLDLQFQALLKALIIYKF